RVVGRPRHLQYQRAVMHASRIDDDEVAEVAPRRLRSIALLVVAVEDFLEVPPPARMLPDVNDWMLDGHIAQQKPLVDQITRIIAGRNATGADHQRVIVGIANGETVDSDSSEEAAADGSQVNLAL